MRGFQFLAIAATAAGVAAAPGNVDDTKISRRSVT